MHQSKSEVDQNVGLVVATIMFLKVICLFHLNDPLYAINTDRRIGAPEIQSTPWIDASHIQ
jgi:hypothetical protein